MKAFKDERRRVKEDAKTGKQPFVFFVISDMTLCVHVTALKAVAV